MKYLTLIALLLTFSKGVYAAEERTPAESRLGVQPDSEFECNHGNNLNRDPDGEAPAVEEDKNKTKDVEEV